ncbi:MAG: hypothetical protein HQM04_17595 [Magnetococcales bacterium]|nr:hypothetical protein [Magnetococcales bacterium]
MMGLMVMVMGGMLYTGGNLSTPAGSNQHQTAPPATGRKLEDVLNTPRMIRNGVMEPTETEKLEKAQEMLDVLRRNGKLGHDHRTGTRSGYGYDRSRDWDSGD